MSGSFGIGSSASSHDHNHNQDDEIDPSSPPVLPSNLDFHSIFPTNTTSTNAFFTTTTPPIHMRQLLIHCADLISRSDLSVAHRLISVLSANSSPYGDSTERLVHHFTKALSLRLTSNVLRNHEESTLLQSSYLSLNQITPFLRFSHLTANQAILEAIDNGQHFIHVIDFDVMQGVQWPPLMQALAERFPTPTLRITGTGSNLDILRKTGDRLSKFAHSLGLRFQFHSLVTTGDDPISLISWLESLVILPDEKLAVNCVHYLHRLLSDRSILRLFLQQIKMMNPRVFTMAEVEANHNHPGFMPRFLEAMDQYAAIFDSLEATLPPTSQERLAVEGVWFGREIKDVVAVEGEERRRERHEMFRSWEVMLKGCGFENLPLSPFAVSQAKLLLRLHYPSEGYQLHVVEGECCLLGWQNQPLFSVSSWQ